MADFIEEFLCSRDGREMYGDGPPQWVEGKRYPRKSSTLRNVQKQRRDLVRALKGDEPALRRLAKILSECTDFKPCASGACPICGRAVQRWFVQQVFNIPGIAEGLWLTVSIVPNFGVFDLDRPPKELLRRFKEQIVFLLNRAGIKKALGGIDPNVNEHQTRLFRPHGQLQAWLLVPTQELSPAAKCKLRASLSRSDTHLRPLRVGQFDGRPNGAAYALKPNYRRRVTQPREIHHNGQATCRQNSRSRDLRVSQARAFARILHEETLLARLILHGWAIDS